MRLPSPAGAQPGGAQGARVPIGSQVPSAAEGAPLPLVRVISFCMCPQVGRAHQSLIVYLRCE